MWKNGNTYEGEFLNGLRSGHGNIWFTGVYKFAVGNICDGEFKED